MMRSRSKKVQTKKAKVTEKKPQLNEEEGES